MNKKVENQRSENKNDKKELTVPAEETTAQKQISESAAEPTQKPTPTDEPTQEVTDKKEQKETITQKQTSEPIAKPTAAAPTKEITDKKEQETVETPTKAQEDELAKEKRLNKQLENLWANGRKQLLNQPPQSKNHSK